MAIETPETRLYVDGVLIKVLNEPVAASQVPCPPGVIYTLNGTDLALLTAAKFKHSLFFASGSRNLYVCDGVSMIQVTPTAIFMESGGGTVLTFTDISDGQLLMRSGNNIMGTPPTAGPVGPTGPAIFLSADEPDSPEPGPPGPIGPQGPVPNFGIDGGDPDEIYGGTEPIDGCIV